MPRRRPDYDEAPVPPDRSLASRLAWGVIGMVGIAVLLRATVVTVVTVDGEGMEPTIHDGDMVLLVRRTGGIERGDVVVYEPRGIEALADAGDPHPKTAPDRGIEPEAHHASTDANAAPALPNTAVVDRAEIERNWQRLQTDTAYGERSPAPLRVGRVLAVPGDTVAFRVPGAALGLAINGQPLRQKDTAPPSLPLTAMPEGSESDDDGRDHARPLPGAHKSTGPRTSSPALRSTPPVGGPPPAYEWLDDLRYPVMPDSRGSTWPGMALPDDGTPVQIIADAYLLLADNRPQGACCDSRELGWIPIDAIEGEIYARLDRHDDERSRGLEWLP